MSWRQKSRRALADFELLLEGKLMIFLIGDFLVLLWGILAAFTRGGKLEEIYRVGVVTPMLLLLPISLSALIALERRAGSLDLALAAPSPPAFFLRRLWAPLGLMLGQGLFLLLLAFGEKSSLADLVAGRFPGWPDLVRALCSMILVAFTIAAALLFWATRLRKGGTVFLAGVATLLPLFPFLYTSPRLAPPPLFARNVFEAYQGELAWLWQMVVLTVATLLLFFAALDRLRRPELMS